MCENSQPCSSKAPPSYFQSFLPLFTCSWVIGLRAYWVVIPSRCCGRMNVVWRGWLELCCWSAFVFWRLRPWSRNDLGLVFRALLSLILGAHYSYTPWVAPFSCLIRIPCLCTFPMVYPQDRYHSSCSRVLSRWWSVSDSWQLSSS